MSQPLVSIISFCKNGRPTIRRSIESVLNQTYQNVEFVVQDGASTDGTLEILQEYAVRDPRIKLVSEPDAGHEEAFWKVLHRCNGEIMGCCLSDEELLPDAAAKAVEIFGSDPEAGAITGNGYITDENGAITGDFIAGEFNLVDYLFDRYCPFFPGTFFRTKALTDIGLSRPGWNLDGIEFELWCRLGTDHVVKSVPDRFSKYSIHAGQLSNTPRNMLRHINARLEIIEKLFSDNGFFGSNNIRKTQCMINQLSMFRDHARVYQLSEQEREFDDRIKVLSKSIAITDRIADSAPFEVESKAIKRASYLWAVMAGAVGAQIRASIGLRTKLWLHKTLRRSFIGLALLRQVIPHVFRRRSQGAENAAGAKASRITKLLKIYLETAGIYEARGQIRQALQMWLAAEPLHDAASESLACQAHLKLPTATEADIRGHHIKWARRHAVPDASKASPKFGPFDGKRKLRIGYHCSFLESDCIRAMMQGAIEKRNREQFSVYAYSPVPLSSDIRDQYDFCRNTQFLDDGEFVDLVRHDEIDILVELTGFSPGHRFAAMASRCAPVQISYLNHTATSAVANVDYVLSDVICTPNDPSVDVCFSEKLYRLSGCFFCFDYDAMPAPPVAPPPSTTRGFITFGCFGSGGKINENLISYWAEMLLRVPNSIFFIKNGQLKFSENRRFIADQFRRFGIEPDRLRLEAGADRQSLLKCYDHVDITLDTWPYCGGNTVAESLWQGVPVVTLYGSRFSSRYGASLVTAAGCHDLVGKSPREYIDIAAGLAGDVDRLTQMRKDLRHMCKEYGLGDSERFARILEEAFVAMSSHR